MLRSRVRKFQGITVIQGSNGNHRASSMNLHRHKVKARRIFKRSNEMMRLLATLNRLKG